MKPNSALAKRLQSALTSREHRLIRRRLPEPPSTLIDFSSNDYLSLAESKELRQAVLNRLSSSHDILGSGGSRLLVNGLAHTALENRLANFFDSPSALLFNSGFDANVGFFSCIPQEGDAIVLDEFIHASVHDGVRASRAKNNIFSFSHNSLSSMQQVLEVLKNREGSVFVAVESLYSMDGTFAPLKEMVEMLESMFPRGNGYLVVDEAHATGVYGPDGKGRTAMYGLEHRVLARLHTFGKAMACTGAILLTNTLIRDYLINYARSLIYTTSLSYSNVLMADCAFDTLLDGSAAARAEKVVKLSSQLTRLLHKRLIDSNIPPALVSLPTHCSDEAAPIIPILTPYPRLLSTHLSEHGMNARPITWPTVPKGADRVRICLHAGNEMEDVEKLVDGVISWAQEKQKSKL